MTACADALSCAFAYLPHAFEIAFAVVAAASAIAAVTPTPEDDRWVGKAYRMIDMLALNIGFAKDRPRPAGGRFVPK